jgi:hypothetical protein
MTRIILLDIDGVLVHHGGYRAALHATLNHFARLMGLDHFKFSEENLSELEKRGIFSEWDMVPLLLGALWEDILSRTPKINLPADVLSAAVEIGSNMNGHVGGELIIPEFKLTAGQYPADSALQSGCYPSVPMDLRVNLLSQSRNVKVSQTMRLVQHYSLGSTLFSKTYGLPAEIQAESMLMHDVSNIDDAIRAKLFQTNIYLAALTARPSAPPREVDDPHLGYAPEAELALELVGLPDIPIIGFGKLEYLAYKHQLDPATLVKPSPVQALAATLAAWTGNEWSSLQAANHWRETGALNEAFDQLPTSFDLIVVEDTMGGIRSTVQAGAILNSSGFNVKVRALGMTNGSPAKKEAFEQAGIESYANWGALMQALDLRDESTPF